MSISTPNPHMQIENGGSIVDEIIRMSDFSYENLPMFKVIGQRLAEAVSVELLEMTGGTCEVSLSRLDYVQVAHAMGELPSPSHYSIVLAPALKAELLLALDATLLMTTLELMLGGSAQGKLKEDKAKFTVIERDFGSQISDLIVSEFQRCFALAEKTGFQLDRVETDAEAVNIAQPTSLCIRMSYSVILSGRVGEFSLILPYEMFETVRHKLNKIHFAEASNGDNPWRGQLEGQIRQSSVELEAVLTEVRVPIGDIMAWKNGATLNLWITDDHKVQLIFNEATMFRAEMGKRSNGNIAMKISETLSLEKEAENGC